MDLEDLTDRELIEEMQERGLFKKFQCSFCWQKNKLSTHDISEE